METRGGRRLLSSKKLTWQYKYFWPGFVVVFIVGATILLWRAPTNEKNSAPIWVGRVLLPIIGISSSAFAIRVGRRIMRVEMDDAGLYVRAGLREVFVPFSEIETCEVTWTSRGAVPVVTVQLRQAFKFGSRIIFFAALPWNKDHSIVAELRERRDLARKQSQNS